jgi:hypothetical protein
MKTAHEKVNYYKRRGRVEEGACCRMEVEGRVVEGEFYIGRVVGNERAEDEDERACGAHLEVESERIPGDR